MNGILGDPAALEAEASVIAAGGRGVADGSDDLVAGSRRVSARWEGAAADAFERHSRRTARRIEDRSRGIRSAPGVLYAYADELRAAQRAFADASQTRQAAERAETAALARRTGAGDDARLAEEAGEDIRHAVRAQATAAAAMTSARARAEAANALAAARLEALTGDVTSHAVTFARPWSVRPVGRQVEGWASDRAWSSGAPLVLPMIPEGGPGAVAAWWSGLTADERAALVQQYPALIGNTDGIPYADRDRANRVLVRRHLSRLRKQLRIAEGACRKATDDWWDSIPGFDRDVDGKLAEVVRLKDEVAMREQWLADDRHTVIAYNTAGDGRAVVAIGKIQDASHIAVVVPGVGSTIGNFHDTHRNAVPCRRDSATLTAECRCHDRVARLRHPGLRPASCAGHGGRGGGAGAPPLHTTTVVGGVAQRRGDGHRAQLRLDDRRRGRPR